MATSTSNSQTNILDIRNVKTRDVVRGLLPRKDDGNVQATFANLMKTVSSEDLATVDDVLRTSELFSHLPLRDEFPIAEPPFSQDSTLVFTPSAELRPAYILHRASKSPKAIAEALLQLNNFNQAIFNIDDSLLFSLPEYIMRFGHSLALARKLAFILGHVDKEETSWKLSFEMFASYGLDSSNYGVIAIADSIGLDFGYLDLKLSFDEFNSIGERATVSQKLAYLSFHPIQIENGAALEALAANYSLSLLDAVHYILCHRELGIFDSNLRFDVVIEDAWQAIQNVNLDCRTFFDPESIFSDLQAFRAAPAFLENEQFRNFRASTQFLFDTSSARLAQLSAPNRFEEEFYGSVQTVRDLLPTGAQLFEPLPSTFNQTTAGSLSRSCGIAKIVERNLDFSELDSNEMASLMGHTIDVDKLLSTAALRQAAGSASDPLVQLILQTLLRSQSPATKDSFQFKQAFQNYVGNKHAGDVVAFLDEIHKKSNVIVNYFAALLDETMLSQMPFLIERAEDVYETRARILEWHGEITGEVISKQKAKQLRIDRKIASVRGQINETRLNIDPLRFRQWIEVSKLSEFSAFVRQDAHKLPLSIDTASKKAIAELRLGGHRDPNLRAIVAVIDCYREFCTNPDFGVASYLGRRIRHGTLRGTLLDGLPNPGEYELSQSIVLQYRRWLRTLEQSTDAIASKLHFVGKGSTGRAVISPEIDSREKSDIVLVCLHHIFENSQGDQGVLGIPLLIEQYCWYIFEVELRDVQRAVLESRNEFGSFKLKHGTGDFSEICFEKAVNISLSSQFATVASWFKKPPNISPVAEIGDIVNVVLREARAEYSSYRPKAQFLAGEDLELSGLVYYHVYDALSIIVRNAAKHGAHPGVITITARTEDRDHGTVLHIEIATKVKDTDSAVKAVERMLLAGEAGPENADVVEGLSGVRKLQKMQLDKAILTFGAKVPPSGDGFLVVSISLALSGIV